MEPSRITADTSPRPQQLRGVVVGAGQMAKTIRVAVERLVWHRKIKKQFRRTKTFLVHDVREEARVGDSVVIEQSRPISKRKRFRILRVERRNAEGGRISEPGERVSGLAGPELASTSEGKGGAWDRGPQRNAMHFAGGAPGGGKP